MILWSTNTTYGLDLMVSKLKQHPLCYQNIMFVSTLLQMKDLKKN